MKSIKSKFKPFLPGLISILIIAGMAVQSFATNVDMAAFVKKDRYMTKYYELDWRIDEINNYLEKLYKFTCTNVKTFGGSRWNTGFDSYGLYVSYDIAGQEEKYYTYRLDFSQDKYLRFGQHDFIMYSTFLYNSAKLTNKMEYEIPGSLLLWRDGVEPAPNCKVKVEIITRNKDFTSNDIVYTIGPIKKLPYIASTGQSLTSGFLCQFPGDLYTTNHTFGEFFYAVNSETLPTSWTSHSGRITKANVSPGNSSSKIPRRTEDDITSVYLSDRYTRNSNVLYFSTVGPNLSSYENVWIRVRSLAQSGGSTSGYTGWANTVNFNEMRLTSWNNNK